MRAIPLSGPKAAGRVALVDDADYALVSQHKWFVQEEGRPGRHPSGPYARTFLWRDGRRVGVMMHAMVTSRSGADHIDHDGLNNQRGNLRPGGARNHQNARGWLSRTSSYKGVSWHTSGAKWRAQIRSPERPRHIGFFASEEEAARAYDKAATVAFGEYAVLNFPPDSCTESENLPPVRA
jgi:hypothetical protein